MSERDAPGSSRTVVAVITAAAVLPALAAVVFWVVDRPPWNLDTGFMAVDVMVALVYGAVAAVLLRHTRHAAAWVLATAAVGGGLAAFGAAYLFHHLERGALPAADPIGTLAGWTWVPGTLALVVVLPWLVRRERTTGAVRWMIAAGTLLCAVVTLVRLTNPAPWPAGDPYMPLAIRDEWWARFSDDVIPWLFAAVVLLGAIASIDVGRRCRGERSTYAHSLRWLSVGAWAMTLSFVPLVVPYHWIDNTVAVPAVTPVLHLAAQAFLPAATLVAVLRQRLWGVDLVVSRALPWGLLTGGLALLYLGAAAAVGVVADDRAVSVALAAAVIGALVVPGHRWLQRRVDLLVHGDADPSAMVREMGAVITGADPTGAALLEQVLTSLASSLRLGLAEIRVATSDGSRTIATTGTTDGADRANGGTVEEIALHHRQELVGWLCAAAPTGERLDTRSRRSLQDVAPVVAALVILVRLNDDLVNAQQRLTTARLEERRVVRRDLHDGLGPALAGIGLGLRASRNLLETDRERAGRLLDELAHEMEQRVSDVREISRALLPPVLDELGLLAAVHDLAARLRQDGLIVEIHADDAGEIDSALATAAFAVISEATANVRRHAAASRVTIAIRCAAHLEVEITDDGIGIGIGDTRSTGVGLRSMRERAVELGGDVEIAADHVGGTVVRWRVPMGATR